MDAIITKKGLRKLIREKKNSLKLPDIAKESLSVFSKVENLEVFKRATNILLYHSLDDELPTHEIIEKWSQTKNIFLPRVEGDDLDVVSYEKDELKVGSFGILEPSAYPISNLQDLDLIIVPAVALDFNGNRLGRGKGYYDRLLPKCHNAYKIGVAFNIQLVDQVPSETFDTKMDAIITDSKQIIINPYIANH